MLEPGRKSQRDKHKQGMHASREKAHEPAGLSQDQLTMIRFLKYLRQRFRCFRGKHRGHYILGVKCCDYCKWQDSDHP